jgi:hypothetical protein
MVGTGSAVSPFLISACLREVGDETDPAIASLRRYKAFPSLVGLGLATLPASVVQFQESSRPRGSRVRPVSQSTGVSASTPYTGGRGASLRRWDVLAFRSGGAPGEPRARRSSYAPEERVYGLLEASFGTRAQRLRSRVNVVKIQGIFAL